MIDCPICGKPVREAKINAHIDSGCSAHVEGSDAATSQSNNSSQQSTPVSSFFQAPNTKRVVSHPIPTPKSALSPQSSTPQPSSNGKRPLDHHPPSTKETAGQIISTHAFASTEQPSKRLKAANAFHKAAPLAERMRPQTLEDVCGQELVGPTGVLRGLIEQDKVPSMILWGAAGTGKTTIARVIATMVGSRFVEINSTSSGVGECKKLFAEAKSELGLTGRKTIIFCDEIHRFSKSQQDVFLGPVESGQVRFPRPVQQSGVLPEPFSRLTSYFLNR